VVINRHIIPIQFRDENSRYGVKRGWKLPDLSKTVRAAQLKYFEGRHSWNVKPPRPPRKQKHDRRDAALLLKLQVENRFPSIWMPSAESIQPCSMSERATAELLKQHKQP
jgi:hypothetical protein